MVGTYIWRPYTSYIRTLFVLHKYVYRCRYGWVGVQCRPLFPLLYSIACAHAHPPGALYFSFANKTARNIFSFHFFLIFFFCWCCLWFTNDWQFIYGCHTGTYDEIFSKWFSQWIMRMTEEYVSERTTWLCRECGVYFDRHCKWEPNQSIGYLVLFFVGFISSVFACMQSK